MFEIGKKVVTLVIDDDKGGEVLDIDLAHGLHAQLGEIDHLDRLDRVLGKNGCRAANRAEVSS